MKLTVQDVAKMTKLSVSTVRQYSWRMKLGTKEGTRKFFTQAEAKKIGSKSLPKAAKKKAKPTKKTATKKKKR